MVFLNHGGGSFDHIQKSVIFIMIRYLFRLHFHFALSILKMIRRTVPAIHGTKYGGITIPERGIIVGKGVFTSQIPEGTAMMQHEYGHILQYLKVGPKAYYSIIAPESLASATFTSVKSHHSFWTETWANYLSKGYFGLKWLGNKIKGYPANNISDLNLLRLRIASIPLFY